MSAATISITENKNPTTSIPVIRKPGFDSGRDLPHYWVNGEPADTYFGNTLHMMFPDGERYFINSVKRFARDIQDPHLKERVRGFLGQEVQHGMQHEACWQALEQQGYPVQNYIGWFRHTALEVLEPWIARVFGPRMNLSVTAAMEHFTAILSEIALVTGWMDRVAPQMRDPMKWHACEEIEHKDVTFDVLRSTGAGYGTRIAGMLLALPVMTLIFVSGFFWCLKHDRERRLSNLFRTFVSGPLRFAWRFGRLPLYVAYYFVPGFHPNWMDNRELIEREMPGIRRIQGGAGLM